MQSAVNKISQFPKKIRNFKPQKFQEIMIDKRVKNAQEAITGIKDNMTLLSADSDFVEFPKIPSPLW